ncbi:MAG: 4-alpha-glucanotransferase [Bacilli bacterium]|nr:4-alpha-glucanotransferase [Bacilli bacterium]
MNTKGLLLPIFSLPSKHGIGDFGKEAFSLLKLLKETGYNTWQILPLNPISYGHSPYQPYSSYAINDLYISLDDLVSRGLLNESPHGLRVGKPHINYEHVKEFKEKYYKQAFLNYINKYGYEELDKFILANPRIDEYAVFMAKKELNHDSVWNNWIAVNQDELNRIEYYHIFKQMILLDEWNKIHDYAKELGITIIGDIPFYVGYDSSDVYFNRQLFLLNEQNAPTLVAGVPPDYFSNLGQRWGNPIYNFEEMKKDGYSFLIDRLVYATTLYDRVRVDHFRAFDTYYVIPSQYPDAKIGEWKFGPAYDFFDELYRRYPNIQIIAEDLGELRPEVYLLRDYYNLQGMNVLEFNLLDMTKDPNFKGSNYDNFLTYFGTHDNQTLRGWVISLKDSQITYFRRFFNKLGINARSLEDMVLKFAFANFKNVIISFVDLMHINNHGRINTPSTVNEVNWTIRLKDLQSLKYYLRKDLNV